MKEQFVQINFRPETMTVIEQANTIITEYQRRGFKLTLRQLYYQFVSRDLMANKQQNYKRLGDVLDKGRQAGLIDWAAIEDRTRNLERLPMWGNAGDFLRSVMPQYRSNPWLTQPYYVEVWIEKDALTGIIEGVCNEFRIPFFACRGYVSQSEMYDAAQRLKFHARNNRQPIILHLGDHDPSGVHMSKDNQDRLDLLSRDCGVKIRRLALTLDQIREYDPPENPAKDTDSRFEGYSDMMIAEGYDPDDVPSWELDALDPDVIDRPIRDELDEIIYPDAWNTFVQWESAEKEALGGVEQNWTGVRRYLKHREKLVLDGPGEYLEDPDLTVDDVIERIDIRDSDGDSE